MPVATELLRLRLQISELQDLVDMASGIKASLNVVKELGAKGVLSETQADDVIATYKQAVKDMAEKVAMRVLGTSGAYTLAAATETANKIKGITPIIAGIPVITPSPVTAAIEEANALGQVVLLAGQLIQLTNTIKDITG